MATLFPPILGVVTLPTIVLFLALVVPRLRAPERSSYEVRLERHRRIASIDTIALLGLLGLTFATCAAVLTSNPSVLLVAAVIGVGVGRLAMAVSRTLGLGLPRGRPPGRPGVEVPQPTRAWLDAVDEMAVAEGIPPPELMVTLEVDPNGCVWPARSGAALVISDGLMEQLDREQATGVVAHLVARLAGHDDLADRNAMALSGFIRTLATILLGVAVPAMVGAAVAVGGTATASTGPEVVTRVALFLVVPVVVAATLDWAGRLVAGPLNVELVLLADARAIALTGNPLGLASALEGMRRGSMLGSVPKAVRHLCFANPDVDEKGRLGAARSAYPSIAERLERIRSGDA